MQLRIKRIGAWLLVLALLFSMAPAAFADEFDETPQEETLAETSEEVSEEESAEESEEETLEEPAEEPIEEISEEPSEEPPVEEITEEPTEEPSEEPGEEPSEEPEQEPSEELSEEPEEELIEEPTEEPVEEPEEDSVEEPVEEPEEEPVEEPEQPAEESQEEIVEEPEEEPVEEPEEETAEEPAEESSEEPEEKELKAFLTKPENAEYRGSITLGQKKNTSIYENKPAYYTFVPTETGMYRFYSLAPEGGSDPVGEVFDSSWNSIKSDDDGAGMPNFQIGVEMTKGQTYYLCVWIYGGKAGTAPVQLDKIKVGWNKIDGYWYYFNSSGNPYNSDFYTINGKTYYFDSNGRLLVNAPIMKEGIAYRADSSGALSALPDGWLKIGQLYYYVKNSELAQGEIMKIGTKYYGFNYSYVMYDDVDFVLNGDRCRAKLGGALYENAWYQGDDGAWYYYGDESSGASYVAAYGLQTVNGKEYLFDNQGRMLANAALDYGGTIYIADSKGSLTIGKNNDWNKVGSYWYYVKNGTLLVDTVEYINGYYYGFDEQGRMYDNTIFKIDSEAYWAGSGGKLYTNKWYKDDLGYWCYFGSDGKVMMGITTIGGKQYALNPEMITNQLIEYGGDLYLAGANGVLTKVNTAQDGWIKAGSDYYYMFSGSPLTDTVQNILGDYYGFDSYGRMYDDEDFEIGGKYYVAHAGGKLYAGEWRYEYKYMGGWSYHNSTGEMVVNSIQTINGKKYRFNSYGIMEIGTEFSESGKYYLIGTNGVITEVHETSSGWIQLNGRYYYLKDGTFAWDEIKEINGKYYAFDDYGRMLEEGYNDDYNVWVSKSGALYTNQWMRDSDGDWMYFVECGEPADGLLQINGKYYVFSSGYLRTDRVSKFGGKVWYSDLDGVATVLSIGWNLKEGEYYYVTADGDYYRDGVFEINGKKYLFYYQGDMMRNDYYQQNNEFYVAGANGALLRNQWYENSSGSRCYLGSDCKAVKGLVTIGGQKYYFYDTGAMARNTVVSQDGKSYIVDISGKLTAAKEGWNQVEKRYYYVYKGEIVTNTVKSINGAYYAFGSYGTMLTGENYVGSGWYRARDNGKLYVNEWYKDSFGDWYYYGEGGKAPANKAAVVNGKTYYFGDYGRMATNCPVQLNEAFFADASGKLTKAKRGWNQFNGGWYYVDRYGQFVKSTAIIDGEMYSFTNYRMNVNEFSYYGAFDSKGHLVSSGWYKYNGYYYYFDPETHEMVHGEKKINGKWYYFCEDNERFAYMYTGEIVLGDKLNVYGADGALVSSTPLKNGWTLVDGTYYYMKNGKRHTGWVGDYYIENGIMLRNMPVDGYYVGQDGKYVKSTWITISYETSGYYYDMSEYLEEGDKLYADETGKLVRSGWKKIGSYWYYFVDYRAITGVYVIDGKVYQFNSYGRMTATLSTTVKDGWLKVGSTYAYIKNGEVLRGYTLYDGNAQYYLDYEGLMVKDRVIRGEYYGTTGKRETVTGWKKVNGKWLYFDNIGYCETGLIEDQGKVYFLDTDYFDYYNMRLYTGWCAYYGLLLHFNSSGVMDEYIAPTKTGWIQKGSDWFYYDAKTGCLSGESMFDRVHSQILVIDGKEYGFDYFGRLVKNTVVIGNNDTCYFCGADGAVAKSEGWKTDTAGKKYYTDANGRVLTGVRIINGKTYYLENPYYDYWD